MRRRNFWVLCVALLLCSGVAAARKGKMAAALRDKVAVGALSAAQLGAYYSRLESIVMQMLAHEGLEAGTAAVLHWDVPASNELAELFRDEFNALGGNVVVSHIYSNNHTRDNEVAPLLHASGVINEIVAAQPDVVFILGYAPHSHPIAEEIAKAGAEVVFVGTGGIIGVDGWGIPDLVDFGGKALEGSYFSDHFTPDGAPAFTEGFGDGLPK